MRASAISNALIVLNCTEISSTLEFFRDVLRFDICSIYPADNPAVVELTGYGLQIELKQSQDRDHSRIKLICDRPEEIAGGQTRIVAPNGTLITLHPKQEDIVIPPLIASFSVCQNNNQSNWIDGRAGMQYRDLIPDRQGGRFIASHIRIPAGGPVPDYVHFHKIRFQMIYCYKGWVKVVYEDQGPPFVMYPGDCVLQPPMIRHRVLESSEGLEVIELGCPAEHHTCVDHALELPNQAFDPDRVFSGQKFVRHQADNAAWDPWRDGKYDARDLGISAATDGLAGARVLKPKSDIESFSMSHQGELMFWFVLQGQISLVCEGYGSVHLHPGDAVTIPPGVQHTIEQASADLEFLEVAIPDVVKFS